MAYQEVDSAVAESLINDDLLREYEDSFRRSRMDEINEAVNKIYG